MLTNHNKDDIKYKLNFPGTSANGVDDFFPRPQQDPLAAPDNNNDTNYNKTKAWKGALAYLFLANQYHKPWTGLYSNSIKSLGPQGVLGLSSINVALPKHSVLILGAVLWRMREAGLLESDKDRWNMSPQYTNGLDPVNYRYR